MAKLPNFPDSVWYSSFVVKFFVWNIPFVAVNDNFVFELYKLYSFGS